MARACFFLEEEWKGSHEVDPFSKAWWLYILEERADTMPEASI